MYKLFERHFMFWLYAVVMQVSVEQYGGERQQ